MDGMDHRIDEQTADLLGQPDLAGKEIVGLLVVQGWSWELYFRDSSDGHIESRHLLVPNERIIEAFAGKTIPTEFQIKQLNTAKPPV